MLLIGFMLCWVGTMYAVLIAKIMPPTNHSALDWLRDDYYYSFLIPLCVPVAASTVYINWLGLKLFRHS
jgi:hypothetical protein